MKPIRVLAVTALSGVLALGIAACGDSSSSDSGSSDSSLSGNITNGGDIITTGAPPAKLIVAPELAEAS